jgi:gliding motility-associated-like protein
VQKNKYILLKSFFLLLTFLTVIKINAQQEIVFNGAYMVMDNKTKLVIDNPSANAVVDNGNGWIISEHEFNQVHWNIGSSTGNYVVPFGNSTADYIPLYVTITGAGSGTGHIDFSTYHGAVWDNTTYMPTNVKNMHGNNILNNSAKAIDRFWVIDAGSYTSKPTTHITFTYQSTDHTGAGNSITEANLFAQRFNPVDSSWADWYGQWGTDNSTLKIVSTGNVTPNNLLRSWVLADQSSPMGVTPVTVQPKPATVCLLMDTSFTVVDTGAGMNYQWLVNKGSGFTAINNAGIYSGATSPTLHLKGITAIMNGYSYYCSIGNGMTASDTVKLTVAPGPVVIATANVNAICKGNNISISASGASSYSWSPSSAIACATCSTTTSSPSASTTYIVIGKDFSGCVDTANVFIVVDTMTVVNISNTQKICAGDSIQLHISGGTSYVWSPATYLDTSSTVSPIAFPPSTTTFAVDVHNGACLMKDSVVVVVNPAPGGVSTSGTATILFGNATPIAVTAQGTNTFSWSPSSSLSCATCANSIATPPATTTYSVLVTDSLGCSAMDFVTITVENICGDVFVPEAFSPDGDGLNDVLHVRGNCLQELEFIIYDRWGNKVFQSNDKYTGWDGTYKGVAMNTGVFGYYIAATLTDGTRVEKKGNVGLVR